MEPWITDAELEEKVREALAKLTTGSGAWDNSTWQTIIPDSNRFAFTYIVSVLLGRGYSMLQLNIWVARKEYNIDLAMWRALIVGGVAGAYDPVFIDKLDRRLELIADEFALVDEDGNVLEPGEEPGEVSGGPVRSGPLVNADDKFSLDDQW